jgi:hypothetical protein
LLHHKYTSIGTYYKNLSKQQKNRYNHDLLNESNRISPAATIKKTNELAGEVVSGEEFSEEDADNFYIQMRNNIQI